MMLEETTLVVLLLLLVVKLLTVRHIHTLRVKRVEQENRVTKARREYNQYYATRQKNEVDLETIRRDRIALDGQLLRQKKTLEEQVQRNIALGGTEEGAGQG